MQVLRVQSSVYSGRAVLHFRNGTEDSVTLTKVQASPWEGEGNFAQLLRAPITLRPGQIHSVDVTDGILKLFNPLGCTKAQKKWVGIRLFVNPEFTENASRAAYSVTLEGSRFTEFAWARDGPRLQPGDKSHPTRNQGGNDQ